MKIGILTPSIYMYEKRYSKRIFAPGVLVRHLVSGLSKRGHEVTWFTAPTESTARVVSGDVELLDNDLQIRIFQDISAKDKMSLYGTKMYYEMDLLTRAYSFAQKEKLDLFHHFHSFGYLAHFFEEMTGKVTLYTLHDPIPTDDMLERWLFDRFPTHKFLSISKSQQGRLAEHFFGNVYNGIDIRRFPFDPSGGQRLIAAGRMVPYKGHDIAIATASRVGMSLAIASWLTDGVRSSDFYKTKIEPLIDDRDIQVYSMMEDESLANFYQNARAFLFPIHWEEPFGLVMIEAMACGTPVVAYNRGSVSEIVRDGVTGFIIEPDDEASTKSQAPNPKQIQNSKFSAKGGPASGWKIQKRGIDGLVEAVKRIGEIDRAACRRHVEEHFTVDRMVDGYIDVYRKVLQK